MGPARTWVARLLACLVVILEQHPALPSTLPPAAAVSVMAEQEHKGCEMYLEAGRMIYVMNHDKRDEFTFCILTSLMRYKRQLPTAVPVAQQCDALFRDLTALWAWCWVPAVAPSPAETLNYCLTHFSASLKSEFGLCPWAAAPSACPRVIKSGQIPAWDDPGPLLSVLVLNGLQKDVFLSTGCSERKTVFTLDR